MEKIGITALVPPEIIFASNNSPMDLNNFVPGSKISPSDKLCAWTAIWRELAKRGVINVKKLVVVSGGDCNNAIVDGERLELSGIDTHYFTYPFDGSIRRLKAEIQRLGEFLGDNLDKGVFKRVREIKKDALEIDGSRVNEEISSEDGFRIEVSGSDLSGDLDNFKEKIENVSPKIGNSAYRVALLGTPPIFNDFHRYLDSIGLHVVYDEMPYEFIRHSGADLISLAESYSRYIFARNIAYRLKFIKRELHKREVDGIIHFHQYACHHKLEDPILRESLNLREGYPYITIEADLPSKTPEQTRLRIEAFKEMMGEEL